ncbi:hypothetical protein GCM10007423_15230 [Dyadobacter endophyticus]|uniref:DUF4249 family protein n=1 Tax=Dyadobacter endophyticus TaxID=1749036 RepID=A0ABQ1YJJ9_9BACT|nr:hypothetical protein [Dyadobacter endophyticus]GGH28561.1 hypothetical protein GCM10007423_15230 [Dyadobacter endophyticus]
MKKFSIHLFGMLAFVILCCFACTDHEPNPEVLPVVKTVEVTFNSQTGKPLFHLRIESTGNVGITEYGVAYLLAPFGNNPADFTPTVDGPKVVFDLPGTVGDHSKSAPFTDAEVEVYFYRSYAKLQNGNVIYGDIYSGD